MKPLRILLTNWTLAGHDPTVHFVRDLAANLFRRGQHPVVFAPETGPMAAELRALTIPAIEHLGQLTAAPDVILGNAQPDLMQALLHFTDAPGIFACHAWDTWLSRPPVFPRVRRYIATDETCREWLVAQNGIPEPRVRLIHPAVDLDRHIPRDPLPEKPRRAAVYDHELTDRTGLNVLREACRRAGLELDVHGAAAGSEPVRPEKVLPAYDLVFAKSRCALEALATGCAVILVDTGLLGGLVTFRNWLELRRQSFGRRTIRLRLDVEHVLAEIARYNAADARAVSRDIRDIASLDDAALSVLDLCRDVAAEHAKAPPPDRDAELQAAGAHLGATDLFRELFALRRQVEHRQAELALTGQQLERTQAELATAAEKVAALEQDLQAIRTSPAGRVMGRLSSLRGHPEKTGKP